MSAEEGLFGKYKQCEYCKRALPARYEYSLCPHCMDAQLFRDVKEFIRANIVNEYEVAEHFKIPLKQVKNWIREGRIEYRTDVPSDSLTMHCQNCGAPVTFGTLCPKCLKVINGNKVVSSQNTAMLGSKMRYLDHDNQSN